MVVKTIRLVCPKCGKGKTVDRDEFDPPAAVRVEIQCGECNPGDFDAPHFFDAAGREVEPLDPGPK